MGWIRVAADRWNFEDADTGRLFVPVGSNYTGLITPEAGFPLFGTDEHTGPDPVSAAREAFLRLRDLGLNCVRLWLDYREFYPTGIRLDPAAINRFDHILDAAREAGLRLMLEVPRPGKKETPNLYFEPPWRDIYLEVIDEFANRYRHEPQIMSYTLIGENSLAWTTSHLTSLWPGWLERRYGTLESLRKTWEMPGRIGERFQDVPVPPPFPLAMKGAGWVGPLEELPPEPLAGSAWLYDYRLFLEDYGTRWVREMAGTIKQASPQHLVTCGLNCWLYPNVPMPYLSNGLNYYFHSPWLDYTCIHIYPVPYNAPGGWGDPLNSDEAMRKTLESYETMTRLAWQGKPVIWEEFGWYGGGSSHFVTDLPFRTEEEERSYLENAVEHSTRYSAGWVHWIWRNFPRAGSTICSLGGLFGEDGKRIKPWGKRYGELARILAAKPLVRESGRSTVDVPLRSLQTSERARILWWRETMSKQRTDGPLDFVVNPIEKHS